MTTGATDPMSTRGTRRSRTRTLVLVGVAVWLALEIWLLTLVADVAGGFTVFLLIVAGIVVGAGVVKRAGRRAFAKLNRTVRGGSEAQEMTGRGEGNALTMLGGLLLMIPGLVSDAAGLLLLLPPVQKAVGRFTENALEKSLRKASPGSLGDVFQQARVHRPDGKVVQGEVIREDRPEPDGGRPPLTH
jgi:UPF0716 protein FxsA